MIKIDRASFWTEEESEGLGPIRHVFGWAPTNSAPEVGAQRSNALLGVLFHEVASTLCDVDSLFHLVDLLEEAPADAAAACSHVRRTVYEKIIAPRLAEQQPQLAPVSTQVLQFWAAVEGLLEWLTSLVRAAQEKGQKHSALRGLFATEKRVHAMFRNPGWKDAVEISGVLDLVLRVPNDHCCLVELKLGQGAVEADLVQACLYHMLLSEMGQAPGTLAVVGFGPERTERLLQNGDVAKLRPRVLDVVARLAHVVPTDDLARPAKRATKNLADKLVSAFREYGVDIKLSDPIEGPTFIRFPVELGRGQLVSRLEGNAENVQVRVGLSQPPLVTIEGSRLVLDVERRDRQVVPFSEVRNGILSQQGPKRAAFLPIGVDLTQTMRFANLADPLNCHLLVAGTTGSGKSEWLRFALAGVSLRYSPNEVRFVLIDPKRTAFRELIGSPYLHGDHGIVFPGDHSVADVLAELAEEMERRYALFAEQSVDDLAAYADRTGTVLPRILIVCDEYYDLIAGGSKEQKTIESGIGRLGAKARAAGIHLILATQQPSRQVIRGPIEANIPCRVGLKTSKSLESRMLLNQNGAEALLGNGDLLFKDVGTPIRLQAPLTTAEERHAIFHPPLKSECAVHGRQATARPDP